jgi:predicted transcriptional regulator
MVTQNYSVRLEPNLVQRLDRLAEAMTEQMAGVRVTRTQALRMAVELGLSQAETKFSVTKMKPKPQRKK